MRMRVAKNLQSWGSGFKQNAFSPELRRPVVTYLQVAPVESSSSEDPACEDHEYLDTSNPTNLLSGAGNKT